MDPLSISASITALLGLATAVLKALVDIKDSDKERRGLEREVINLLSFLQTLRSHVERAEVDQACSQSTRMLSEPTGTLEQMHDEIGVLLSLVKQSDGRRKVIASRVTWPFDRLNAYRSIDKINRLKADVSLALGQDHFNLSLQIRNDGLITKDSVQSLRASAFEREALEVRQWLSPLDFLAHHFEIAQERTPETGSSFLKSANFEQWASCTQPKAGRILYCPGNPGAGKTFLASAAIDHVQSLNPESPMAFVYFDYKNSNAQTSYNILGAILCQLSKWSPDFARRLYQKHRPISSRPSVLELENAITSILYESSQTFIILDGLDEATEEVRTLVLGLVLTLQWSERVNILMTSRKLEIISQYFEVDKTACDSCDLLIWGSHYHCTTCRGGDFDICLACHSNGVRCYEKHELSKRTSIQEEHIYADKDDIQLFLQQRIQLEPRLRRCVQKQPRIKDRIIEVANEEFEGLFLPAKLLIDVLKDKASPAAVLKALDTMKDGSLSSMYDYVIERIRGQSQYDWDLALQVLGWIVYGYRPLTVTEMQHALACTEATRFNEDELVDPDVLVNVCGGLVEILDGAFHLVHKTAHEYFQGSSGASLFPDNHARLARTCLSYLYLDDFESGPSQGEEEDAAFLQRLDAFPFYNYASQCWGAHIAVLDAVDADIVDAAIDLLTDTPKLEAAIQAMWFLNVTWDVRRDLTGLHIASFFGLADIVTKLLERGDIVDARDSLCSTPLIYAAKSGSAKTVTTLLRSGANINAQDRGGGTALLHAVTQAHVSVTEALLTDPNLNINYVNTNWHDASALTIACSKRHAYQNQWHEIVHLLLERRPDLQINQKNSMGRTPLWLATYCNNIPIVRDLCNQPTIDLNTSANRSGHTPLHIAACNRNLLSATILIDAGADIDSRDKDLGSPLLRACDAGATDIVQLFLSRGADINTCDVHGRTLLHSAAVNGHHRLIRFLLEQRMDPNLKANNGATPFTVCKNKISPAHAETLKALVEFGAGVSTTDDSKADDLPLPTPLSPPIDELYDVKEAAAEEQRRQEEEASEELVPPQQSPPTDPETLVLQRSVQEIPPPPPYDASWEMYELRRWRNGQTG